jgi:transposase
LDAFHVIRLGFAAVDDVRRRVQQLDLGHRGRRGDPLYRIRRVLRRGHEHLTDLAWERLLTGLDVGDVERQVAAAWIAAQDLRLIYRAKTREAADRRLYRRLVHCADSNVPELHRLAATIDAWREELLAYFDTSGVSNGPTEAMNLSSKRSREPGTASATSTTTGSDSCCTAASPGTLHHQHESEAGYHGWLRRAGKAV